MKTGALWICLGLGCLLAGCANANLTTDAPREYISWLKGLKQEMREKGISQKTLDQVYVQDYYHSQPEAVKIDRRQTEFILSSTDYVNRIINRKKVEEGRKLAKELAPLLQPISRQYGIPAEYIIAFWGLETNYGKNFGSYLTVEVLTQLSYDRRRSAFFKKELYETLKIIDTWQIDYTKIQGSWAGAMGHFQFMPSTFNAYAVDYNRDGQIDIWHSFEDAAASAANYLSSLGWQENQPWGSEATLPWNFDFSLSGRQTRKPIKEWLDMGVKPLNNLAQIKADPQALASLIVPEGRKGKAYLILDNFRRIMVWNRSENYALAIGILADYIASEAPWQPLKADPSLRLKTDDVMAFQTLINRLGWFQLQEDGKLGTATREAVRDVQTRANLPADGYPDYRLLQKIRAYNPEIGFSVPVPERKLHNGGKEALRSRK